MLACRLIRNDELKAVCYIIIRVIIYPMSVFACACGCFCAYFCPRLCRPSACQKPLVAYRWSAVCQASQRCVNFVTAFDWWKAAHIPSLCVWSGKHEFWNRILIFTQSYDANVFFFSVVLRTQHLCFVAFGRRWDLASLETILWV